MKNLVGACMFAQSGGPTSVINASAAGVFLEALDQKNITAVYGAAHGIKGVLNEQFYDIGKEDRKELELLKYTPSSALGSVRYKLKDASVDDTDYKRIVEVFKKYNDEIYRVILEHEKKHKKAAKSIKNEKRELISEAALTESFGDFENNANGVRESDNDD